LLGQFPCGVIESAAVLLINNLPIWQVLFLADVQLYANDVLLLPLKKHTKHKLAGTHKCKTSLVFKALHCVVL